MFTGLSAFSLTPFKNEKIDFGAFDKLISNLVQAEVDSICAMGSTGLYPYLSLEERRNVAKRTVDNANGIPVMVGIGALRTYDVLKHAEAAQQSGVNALLLAPVSYHPLHQEEVLSLYETVCKNISVPLCVYDNPGVTQFKFSDELFKEVSRLENVAAIKIPGMPFATDEGKTLLDNMRVIVPDTVAIGVSGDKFGAAGMAAGCDLWLSVVGGLFPNTVMAIIRAVQEGNPQNAEKQSTRLEPLWQLFAQYRGGVRVMATAADILGYTEDNCLPQPLLPLQASDKAKLEDLLREWRLT